MYSTEEYNKLVSKYGSYASWAIWDYKDESDLSIISKNVNQLHSKYILLGLNISHPLSNKPWLNFHGGSIHDRKLKYACNDTILRGSYITDIFKGIEVTQSNKLKNVLTDKIISENVSLFNREVLDIEFNENSQFIVFGAPKSFLAQCFDNYFKQKYNNRVIFHHHYSYYGVTDKEWVTGLWQKLNINQDFDQITNKYKTSNLGL